MQKSENVFDYRDYKAYLKFRIDSLTERGIVKKMAEAAGCQRSYLSQALNGKVHLTKDHGWGICEFLHLSDLESAYFLLLLELARAVSRSYRAKIERELLEIKKQRDDLGKRVRRQEVGTSKEAQSYYSAWYMSAIHILLSIDGYKTADAIARRLELPVQLAESALSNLERLGFAKRTQSGWGFLGRGIHVPHHSPLVAFHHANWRQRAVFNAQTLDSRSVHFTNIQSMSRETFEVLKQMMRDFVEKANQLSEPSPAEELVGMTLDLFVP